MATDSRIEAALLSVLGGLGLILTDDVADDTAPGGDIISAALHDPSNNPCTLWVHVHSRRCGGAAGLAAAAVAIGHGVVALVVLLGLLIVLLGLLLLAAALRYAFVPEVIEPALEVILRDLDELAFWRWDGTRAASRLP